MDKDADVERAIGLERRRWAEVDEALPEIYYVLSHGGALAQIQAIVRKIN